MVMTRSDHARQLQNGLNTVFGLNYKRWQTEWDKVFEVFNSQKAYEEEVLDVGFAPAPVKGEGEGVAYDDGQEAWTARYNHETIALAFGITEEALEDNLYGDLGARYSKALSTSVQETKEIKGAAVINNSGTGGAYAGGDGVALCSTAHPLANGATLANKLATSSDLSETALEDVMIRIAGFTDDRGIPMQLEGFKLVIPRQLKYTAIRLLRSNLRPGTADNDPNAIRESGDLSGGYAVMRRITNSSAWFITTDCQDGLKHFVRKKLSRKMEGEFESGNARYKVRERYSFGWTNWRGIFSSGHI